MTIQGLHHITLVCADAQRTVDFYTGVLGLHLVKKTVNFDDPGAYHLYFGDAVGTPGSAVTFFEWPHAQKGRPGIGGTHHLALSVADHDGLLKWKRRLTDLRIEVSGPYERYYFSSIYFRDPDGVILEIATLGPGMTVDEEADNLGTTGRRPPAPFTRGERDESQIAATTWDRPVSTIDQSMALQHGIHHISSISADIQRTDRFLSEVLGLRRIKMTANFDDPAMAHWYWGNKNGDPGTLITYFEYDLSRKRYHRVRMGAGQTHHYAFAVPDEETQIVYRQRLLDAGYRVSPVMDRIYFKSIYTNDPDGHIVELATYGPGFTVDEDEASLGNALMLPPWLERHRTDVESALTPIRTTNPHTIKVGS